MAQMWSKQLTTMIVRAVMSLKRGQRPTSVVCLCGSLQKSNYQRIPRRHLMISLTVAPFLSGLCQPSVALAETAQKLPKGVLRCGLARPANWYPTHALIAYFSHYACAGYEEFAGKLIGALQDAIEADLSDMEERQVPSQPILRKLGWACHLSCNERVHTCTG